MTYTTKNYTEQGGEKTVIGGVLEIKKGASITGLPVVDNQAGSTATEVAELKADQRKRNSTRVRFRNTM
jgi:hypothetical protein